MVKSSCVQHPPAMTIVMIRQDYVVLCSDAPDPHCAAALLNNMEFWTNIKLAIQKQLQIENELAANEGLPLIPDDDTWVYKTHEETQEELLDVFGRNKIVTNTAWLVSQGYIKTRNNPRYKWDKTKQYSLDIQTLQDAISNLPSFKTKRSKRIKLNDAKLRIKRAIPQTTSQTTSQNTKEIDSSPQNGDVKTPNALSVVDGKEVTANVPEEPPNPVPSPLPPANGRKPVPHYPYYLALLKCWGFEADKVTSSTRTNYMKVAVDLQKVNFPLERIPDLHQYVCQLAKKGKWSSFTVNAIGKYADEYLAKQPKRTIPEEPDSWGIPSTIEL